MTFNIRGVLDAVADAENAILQDLRREATKNAKADAPVTTGAYRDGLEATDEGIAGNADYSIFVELKHNTIANAVERLKSNVDSIAGRHTL